LLLIWQSKSAISLDSFRTTLKFERVLVQNLVVPIGIFLERDSMSNTIQTTKVSSENCQTLTRLGIFEDLLDESIEGLLLSIYYELEKNTRRAATDDGRAAIGEPNNTDMNIVADGKRLLDDDSNTLSDHVIIISLYLPRIDTDRCLECCRRNYYSKVYKK
jgi:hypothetical protein